jgi:hypothetical protein
VNGSITPSVVTEPLQGQSRCGAHRVVAVPPWPTSTTGLGASVLPQSYRDLLEAATDTGRPLRAAQIAAAGLSMD